MKKFVFVYYGRVRAEDISKEDMKSLFLSVAADLGHKKFVKKEKLHFILMR